MPFTLNIHFSGLCMFVPAPIIGTNGIMHVLMPAVEGHIHGADRHMPVLGVHTSHLGDPTSTASTYALFPLWDSVLDIGATNDAVLDLCPQIPDLKLVTGRPVKADLLHTNDYGQLVARIALCAGAMKGVKAGVCCEWNPGTVQRIPHILEWTVPFPSQNDLTLRLKGFDGVQKTLLPVLTPIDDVIRAFIYHVPFGEVPPNPDTSAHRPNVGDQPAHFTAYYNLFGGPVPIRLPRFWSDEVDCAPLNTGMCPGADEGPKGEVAFNCMLARTS